MRCAKIEQNLLQNHRCNRDAATPSRFTIAQLQKTMELRTQPHHQGTSMQPPLRSAKAELQSAVDLRATTTEIAARKADLGARTANKKCLEALLKKECRKENELRQNWANSVAKSPSQPWCSSQSHAIYDAQLQKTMAAPRNHWCSQSTAIAKTELQNTKLPANLSVQSHLGCSNSNAIYRPCVAKDHRIAGHTWRKVTLMHHLQCPM